MMNRFGFGVLIWAVISALLGPALAGKGDLKPSVPRSAPLLKGKMLDLRFAEFAQGIWVRDPANCPARRIDATEPGSTIAIFRGLLETPGRICQVYGAEKDKLKTQRAAINCLFTDGGEAIELVTVQPRGSNGLLIQEGERPPVHFRFCEPVQTVLDDSANR